MSGETDVNVVIGQGKTITEIQGVKKQGLSLNQQYLGQTTQETKQKKRSTLQESEKGNTIQDKPDERKGGGRDDEEREKQPANEDNQEKDESSAGNFIDVKV